MNRKTSSKASSSGTKLSDSIWNIAQSSRSEDRGKWQQVTAGALKKKSKPATNMVQSSSNTASSKQLSERVGSIEKRSEPSGKTNPKKKTRESMMQTESMESDSDDETGMEKTIYTESTSNEQSMPGSGFGEAQHELITKGYDEALAEAEMARHKMRLKILARARSSLMDETELKQLSMVEDNFIRSIDVNAFVDEVIRLPF